jgi:hypothetical protein
VPFAEPTVVSLVNPTNRKDMLAINSVILQKECIMRVSVELIGGPFDGKKVFVEPGENVEYMRQVPNDQYDNVAIYMGSSSEGKLRFVQETPIEYDAR